MQSAWKLLAGLTDKWTLPTIIFNSDTMKKMYNYVLFIRIIVIFFRLEFFLPTRLCLQKFLRWPVWPVTQPGACHPTSWCQASQNKHTFEESTFKVCPNVAKFQVAQVLSIPHDPITQNKLCRKRQVLRVLHIYKILPKCTQWMFHHSCAFFLKIFHRNALVNQGIITNTLDLKERNF